MNPNTDQGLLTGDSYQIIFGPKKVDFGTVDSSRGGGQNQPFWDKWVVMARNPDRIPQSPRNDWRCAVPRSPSRLACRRPAYSSAVAGLIMRMSSETLLAGKPLISEWRWMSLSSSLPLVRDVRRFGGAAIDLCSVACGRVDGYYERGLNPWDHAAGALIAHEAGARVEVPDDGAVVAATPGIFDDLAELISSAGAHQA